MNARVSNANLQLRPFGNEDLPHAAALSRAVSWPHREEDWRFMLDLGEGLVCVQNKKLAGTAMAWMFGEDAAAIGMIITDPAQRRRGIGARLTEALLARTKQRRVVLYATCEGAPLYRRFGFADGERVLQYQGEVTVAAHSERRIRPLLPTDLAALKQLDQAACGCVRERALKILLATADGVAYVDGDRLTGFAFCRPFGRGRVVGPVVAPSKDIATALIAHWLQRYAGHFIRLDVPAASGLQKWLRSCGLSQAGEALAMHRGERPDKEKTTCFALLSQALG